jgi:carboxymethylenebutenolidase
MVEHQIVLALAEGEAETFVAQPDGVGPFPVLLFYMDGNGLREELFEMARRFASQGYFVVLPNLFYRAGSDTRLGEDVNDPESAEFQRMWSLIQMLSIDKVLADTEKLVAWVGHQPHADGSKMAVLGYCMSGQFAVATAARWPDRIKAAASLYGVALVTDAENSPHRLLGQARAEIYLGFAELDRYAPVSDIPALKKAGNEARAALTIETYPGVDHGFGFPQRGTYDRAAAERHWERLGALFDRTLHHD